MKFEASRFLPMVAGTLAFASIAYGGWGWHGHARHGYFAVPSQFGAAAPLVTGGAAVDDFGGQLARSAVIPRVSYYDRVVGLDGFVDRSVAFDRVYRVRFDDLDFDDDSTNDSSDFESQLVRSGDDRFGTALDVIEALQSLNLGSGSGGDMVALRGEIDDLRDSIDELKRLQTDRLEQLEAAVSQMQRHAELEAEAEWRAGIERTLSDLKAAIDAKQ